MNAPVQRDARRLRLAANAAVAANILIVVTGGLVRVTGSGLGCPQWPTCDGQNLVPVPGGEHAGWQAAIEFGNRLLTFVVLAAVVAVFVQVRRTRPHPVVVERLAWLLPLGVLAQALLGGITVLTGLSPFTVAGHFLLSMVLIAAAVTLRERIRPVPPEPAPRAVRHLSLATVIAAAAVLMLGTVVTGAGPHGGDLNAARFPIDIRLAAIAHADGVWLLFGLTVALVVVTRRAHDSRLRDSAVALLILELLQGTVGYTQYVLGVPAALVALHILGAATVWATAFWIWAQSTQPAISSRDVEDAAGL